MVAENGPYLIIFVIYGILIALVLLTQNQVFLPSVGDQPVGFFPLGSGTSIFSAWTPSNLGSPIQNGLGKFLFFLLQSAFQSAFLAQLTTYFGLFMLASLGLVFAFKNLGLIKNPYLLIPISISLPLNWTIFQTLQLIQIGTAAALPFLFLYGVRAVYGIGKRRWNLLGLVFGFLVITLFSNVVGFGAAFIILLPILLSRLILSSKPGDFTDFGKGLFVIVAAIGITTLVALPFYYNGYYLLLSGGFHNYVSVSSGSSLTSVTPLGLLQYMHTLMPVRLSPFLTATSPLLDNNFWPLGLLIPILAGLGLFVSNRMQMALSTAYLVLMILLIGLINLILSSQQIINTLYDKIPLLFVLIEAQDYAYIMTPVWILLAGLGIATVERKIHSLPSTQRRIFQITVFTVAVLVLLSTISAFDFMPADFSSVYQTPLNYNGYSFPAQPPQPILSLFLELQAMRASQGPFRILWLPYPIWLTQLFYAEGSPDSLNINTLGNKAEANSLVSVLNDFITGNITNLAEGLALLDFKYIVVPTFFSTGDPISFNIVGNSPVQILGDPSLFEKILVGQNDLRLLQSQPSFQLYENLKISNETSGVFWLSNDLNFSGKDDQVDINTTNSPEILSMTPTYSPSEFKLLVNSSQPTWLIFDQTFDQNWVAKIVGNQSYLDHGVALGWANAFYIPSSGQKTILLVYSPQSLYDYIWFFSGIFVILLTASYAAVEYLEKGAERKTIHVQPVSKLD